MLPINEYKKLTKDSQKCSLPFWLDELLAVTQLENINQLTDHLAESFPEQCEPKRKSKYLYKKSRGQPIKDDGYVWFLDEKLSGGADVLFSPLWALLEYEALSTAEAVKLAGYLPFDIQKRVLSNDRRSIKGSEKTIYKLAQLNSFDALTAMCLIYLYIKPSMDSYSKLVVDKELTLFIISLFITRFKNFEAGYCLVKRLSKLFNHSKSVSYLDYAHFIIWENEKPHSFNMPVTLRTITCPKNLQGCCALLKYIVTKTTKLLSLENNSAMTHQILSRLNLLEIDELTWNFYQIETGGKLRSSAELWKLRDRIPA